MSFTRESAAERAKEDLAKRLNISEKDISVSKVSDEDFPNTSLGAPVDGEMSGMMMSGGWQITLAAGGKKYDYRADQYQLRLKGFNGTNHIVVS